MNLQTSRIFIISGRLLYLYATKLNSALHFATNFLLFIFYAVIPDGASRKFNFS